MEHITKKVGVWMESSIAHLMDFSKSPSEIKTIKSNFKKQQLIISTQKNELHLLFQEKNKKAKYYNKIINIIADYNEVILFGHYNSKYEFFKAVAADSRFQYSKKILLQPSDKMTSGQQKKAFVKGYYAK